ncbi:hypothetical protein GCM10011533_12640 [Streptosporangium jomthongense]|nr:hypothetical protein GCM10011533_12640 [Streptosporangium jomthongense]
MAEFVDHLNPCALGAEKSPDSKESYTIDSPLVKVANAKSHAAVKVSANLFIEFSGMV